MPGTTALVHLGSQTSRHPDFFTQFWSLTLFPWRISVDFYSPDRRFLGSELSLKHLISEATGLPIKVVDARDLFHSSIEVQLLWAARLI